MIRTIKPTFWAALSLNGVVYEHTIRATRKAAADAFIAAGTDGATQRWDAFHGVDRGGERMRVVKVRVVPVEENREESTNNKGR